MLDQLDLNEVAEAYFSVRAPDRLEYERLLIRARDEAVPPLLNALLVVASEGNKRLATVARREQFSANEEERARIFWAKGLAELLIQAAYDVVRRIGPPAQMRLCVMLVHHEYKVRLAAALLLAMNNPPSEKVLSDIYFYLLMTIIETTFFGLAMAAHRVPCRSPVSRSLRLSLDTASLAWLGKGAPSLRQKTNGFCWCVIDVTGKNNRRQTHPVCRS
jgi:hypothetical protein